MSEINRARYQSSSYRLARGQRKAASSLVLDVVEKRAGYAAVAGCSTVWRIQARKRVRIEVPTAGALKYIGISAQHAIRVMVLLGGWGSREVLCPRVRETHSAGWTTRQINQVGKRVCYLDMSTVTLRSCAILS